MLKLFLDYYGEYANDKYMDMHLYDEDGVYMTFRYCDIFLVNYKGNKSIEMTDNHMNIYSYLHNTVDLIDRKYKVSKDLFSADKVCWHLDGKIRLARKFDLSRKDNFSFPAQRKDYYGIYEGRNRDLYIYAPKEDTLDANCMDGTYSDKLVTAYRDVAIMVGDITIDGTYYQYLLKDAPFEGKVCEKSRFSNGHKCVINKVSNYKIENFNLFVTSNNVTTIDGELRKKSKKLAEAIRTKANTFRLKDITYADIEAMLKHFDIIEK